MAAKLKATPVEEENGLREPFERFEASHMPAETLEIPEVIASPVHDLQAGLVAEFSPTNPGVSRRQIYGTVVVFCFAVWWAVYSLASALV